MKVVGEILQDLEILKRLLKHNANLKIRINYFLTLPKFLTRLPFFPVFVCTLKLISGSNSHFIFNNCLLGYCHQSDVSKLPQVISDHCKRINTE